jgi:hypothetical protein
MTMAQSFKLKGDVRKTVFGDWVPGVPGQSFWETKFEKPEGW